MEVLEHFNLQHYNTFHVSAHARYFYQCDRHQLPEGCPWIRQGQEPALHDDRTGSNLLFRENYLGIILEMNIHGKRIKAKEGDDVLVEAKSGKTGTLSLSGAWKTSVTESKICH